MKPTPNPPAPHKMQYMKEVLCALAHSSPTPSAPKAEQVPQEVREVVDRILGFALRCDTSLQYDLKEGIKQIEDLVRRRVDRENNESELAHLRADLAREKERADKTEERNANLSALWKSSESRTTALEKGLAGSQTHCRAAYRLAQEYGYSQFSSEAPAEYLTRMLRIEIGNETARADSNAATVVAMARAVQSAESRLAALQGTAKEVVNAWDGCAHVGVQLGSDRLCDSLFHLRAFTAEGQKP